MINITFFIPPFFSFSKPGAYITQNATEPFNDTPWGSFSDNMQLLLEPKQAMYYFTYEVLLPKTLKHT